MDIAQDHTRRHCTEVLLPIWERWTGNDPSMRGLLDCDARPIEYAAREGHLIAALDVLQPYDAHPQVAPAITAACAVLAASFRMGSAAFWTLASRAEELDLMARECTSQP